MEFKVHNLAKPYKFLLNRTQQTKMVFKILTGRSILRKRKVENVNQPPLIICVVLIIDPSILKNPLLLHTFLYCRGYVLFKTDLIVGL